VESVLGQQSAFAQTVANIEQEQAQDVAAIEKKYHLTGTLSYGQAIAYAQNFEEGIERLLSRFREFNLMDALDAEDSAGFNDEEDDSGTFLISTNVGGAVGYRNKGVRTLF
jgi:N-dimethylarginine dimethylaminohydrolase